MTLTEVNQVSDVIVDMIIFDVDKYSVVMNMSYILIYVNCLWINMLMT